MSNNTPPPTGQAQPSPVQSLTDLKSRLANAQPVVVDKEGRLHNPDSPGIAGTAPQEKTTLKPQRWFSPARHP